MKGGTKKAELRNALIRNVDAAIATAMDLKNPVPKEAFSPKNAMEYFTSHAFMLQSKTMVLTTFDKSFQMVETSFKRRAALVYKAVARAAIKVRLEAQRKKIEAARAKVLAIREKKRLALEKLKAIKVKCTFVKTEQDKEELSNEKYKSI